MLTTLRRRDLVHPELCYTIVGALFEVSNGVGPSHRESFYQKAVARELARAGLSYREQVPVRFRYKAEPIGLYYLDFLIDGKIILEIKVRDYFSKRDSYLRATGLQLGIIAHFTKSGVKFKRIVNIV
jgi:GxxExxY protein